MREAARPNGVAIITGAARGIGAACARALAEDGWPELLLCDISGDMLADMAQQLHNTGAKVETLAGDVTAPDFMTQMIERCGERQVAAAVHAAGVSPRMVDTPRMLEINLDSAIAFADAIKPRMAEGAAAVMIASNTSYFPVDEELKVLFEQPMPSEGAIAFADRVPDSFTAYLLAKRGVRALARREAGAFGEREARIVSISPGLIDTVMTEDRSTEIIRRMIDESALRRVGDTAELAAVVAFLVSPNASFMTGCDVLVDGGEAAGMGYL